MFSISVFYYNTVIIEYDLYCKNLWNVNEFYWILLYSSPWNINDGESHRHLVPQFIMSLVAAKCCSWTSYPLFYPFHSLTHKRCMHRSVELCNFYGPVAYHIYFSCVITLQFLFRVFTYVSYSRLMVTVLETIQFIRLSCFLLD